MSNEVNLHFRKAGLLTTIQDQGRSGYQAFGVPVAGALDQTAAKTANFLVGNVPNAPVLEITLIGPEIVVNGDCQIAICGANLSPTCNGTFLPMYETVHLKDGDSIKFGRAQNGCRAYLAVGGQWLIKPWLGSYSASAQNGLELTPESLIRKEIQLKIIPAPFIDKRIIAPSERQSYPTSLRVRVLPGPEFASFSALAIGYFFSHAYKVSRDSNRMGYRLEGQRIDFHPENEVISAGIIPGTIQVTNAGHAILLLADAQTTGGYHRIANVIQADLDKLAQLKPGDEIWFSLITLEEAKQLNQNEVYPS